MNLINRIIKSVEKSSKKKTLRSIKKISESFASRHLNIKIAYNFLEIIRLIKNGEKEGVAVRILLSNYGNLVAENINLLLNELKYSKDLYQESICLLLEDAYSYFSKDQARDMKECIKDGEIRFEIRLEILRIYLLWVQDSLEADERNIFNSLEIEDLYRFLLKIKPEERKEFLKILEKCKPKIRKSCLTY